MSVYVCVCACVPSFHLGQLQTPSRAGCFGCPTRRPSDSILAEANSRLVHRMFNQAGAYLPFSPVTSIVWNPPLFPSRHQPTRVGSRVIFLSLSFPLSPLEAEETSLVWDPGWAQNHRFALFAVTRVSFWEGGSALRPVDVIFGKGSRAIASSVSRRLVFFFPWFFFLFTALTPDGNDVAAGADHVRTRKAGKQEPSNGKAAHNLTTLNSSTTWLHDFIPFTDCAVPCRKYSSYYSHSAPGGVLLPAPQSDRCTASDAHSSHSGD